MKKETKRKVLKGAAIGGAAAGGAYLGKKAGGAIARKAYGVAAKMGKGGSRRASLARRFTSFMKGRSAKLLTKSDRYLKGRSAAGYLPGAGIAGGGVALGTRKKKRK